MEQRRTALRRFVLIALALAMMPVFAASAAPSVTIDVIRRGADGSVTVEYISSLESLVPEMLVALRTDPAVIAAGVAHERSIVGSPAVSGTDDPEVGSQWGYRRLAGPAAARVGTGSSQVVAVLDTGVDASHVELQGRVLPGWDAIDPIGDGRFDPNGHGTHVAGVIAAAAGNGLGVHGFAPDVAILPVRVLGADGVGDDTHLALGIIWAADHGADVMNLSIGGAVPSTLLEDAIDYAFDKGVLVVVAAGNDALSGNAPSYPAAYPEALAVAATDQSDRRSFFSNTGAYVDIAAPGSWIMSTWPGNRYMSMSGTSMAAPFVAAAAVLVGQHTGLSGRPLRDLLVSQAVDIGAPGKDDETGAGLVNVLGPLGETLPPPEAGGGVPLLPLPELPKLPLPQLPALPVLTPPSLPTPSLPVPRTPTPPTSPAQPPSVSPPPSTPPPSTPPTSTTPAHDVDVAASATRSGAASQLTIRLSGSKALTARQLVEVRWGSSTRRIRTGWDGVARVRVTAPRGTQVTVTLPSSPFHGPVSRSVTL